MFAGEHGNCTKQVGNEGKMACEVAMADLNLTADQKTKMDALMTSITRKVARRRAKPNT